MQTCQRKQYVPATEIIMCRSVLYSKIYIYIYTMCVCTCVRVSIRVSEIADFFFLWKVVKLDDLHVYRMRLRNA